MIGAQMPEENDSTTTAASPPVSTSAVRGPVRQQDDTFVEFMRAVQDGRLVDDLNSQLREMVLALNQLARSQGGKPKGTLKINISFKLEDGVLEVLAKSETALPKPLVSRSIFYALQDGRVTENNPRQLGMDLPVRDVAAPAATNVRSIGLPGRDR